MNSLPLSLSPRTQRCHIAERRQHRCQRAGEQFAHIEAPRATDLCALWRRHQRRSVSSQSGGFLGEARGAMCQVADQGRGRQSNSNRTRSPYMSQSLSLPLPLHSPWCCRVHVWPSLLSHTICPRSWAAHCNSTTICGCSSAR